jgi:hypothetical protein
MIQATQGNGRKRREVMARDSKTISRKNKPSGKAKKKGTNGSLRNGMTPADRLENHQKEARGNGHHPMTAAKFDEWMNGTEPGWPEDENIDEFLAWLYKSRREGRYS